MAHSSSVPPVLELARYRGRQIDTNDITSRRPPGAVARRYDSFDSTFTSKIDDDRLSLPRTLTTVTSLLERPITRRLVFRRHWFHSDMTVYSTHASPTPSSDPAPEVSSYSSCSAPSPQVQEGVEIETPVYHLATYELNFWQPDIIMYAGGKPDPAHVLALSHFRWSRTAHMGFGADCLDDKSPNTTWEDLRNTSSYLLHHTYEFSLTTPQGARHFRLQRTHAASDGVEGWAGWMSCRNYRLIDMAAHETIGVFLADNLRSLTKKGELRLFRSLAKEVEVGVVLAFGVVSEKATRRERKSRHHGGGGAG